MATIYFLSAGGAILLVIMLSLNGFLCSVFDM
jgi:hypothetical protein